jgi:hypothetical protein
VTTTPCVVSQLEFAAFKGDVLELTAYDVAGKARLTTQFNAIQAEFVAVSTSDTSALMKGLLLGVQKGASLFCILCFERREICGQL